MVIDRLQEAHLQSEGLSKPPRSLNHLPLHTGQMSSDMDRTVSMDPWSRCGMININSFSGMVDSFRFCKNMVKIGGLVKMHVWEGYDFVVY